MQIQSPFRRRDADYTTVIQSVSSAFSSVARLNSLCQMCDVFNCVYESCSQTRERDEAIAVPRPGKHQKLHERMSSLFSTNSTENQKPTAR